VLLGGCRELDDIRQIVDAHDDACAVARQPRQPVDLGWIAHLVRHEHILDTGACEDFGLRDLLTADANRPAEFLLQAQHVDGFVHLPVRAVAHVVVFGIVAHLADVALECIEIEDQARRLDLILGHARNSRDIISDLETGEFGFDVHVVVLPYCRANLSRSTLPPSDDNRPHVMKSRCVIRSPRLRCRAPIEVRSGQTFWRFCG